MEENSRKNQSSLNRLTKEDCREFIQTNLFSPAKSKFSTDRIGMELESIPFAMNPEGIPQLVSLLDPERSLLDLLNKASEIEGGKPSFFQLPDQQASLIRIDFSDGSNFQFEPGGQVEIVTSPCENLSQLRSQLFQKQKLLSGLESRGFFFAQIGTNPWFGTEEIGLQLQKPRYRALQGYFEKIGPFGLQMMRQTCSLQLNLDLGNNRETQVKRILLANLLAPFVTAIFSNSPIIGGQKTGMKSYRGHIWQKLDSRRTGILPLAKISKPFELENLVDAYFQMALKAPLIYLEEFDGEVLPQEFTLEHALENKIRGIEIGLVHLKNHVSLLFPEVRMKGFMEIRSIDSLPPEWQLVPAAFYRTLFYQRSVLDAALEIVLPHVDELEELLNEATFGIVSDRICATSKRLFELALENFETETSDLRDFEDLQTYYQRYTSQRRSPADDDFFNFK